MEHVLTGGLVCNKAPDVQNAAILALETILEAPDSSFFLCFAAEATGGEGPFYFGGEIL